MNKKDVMSAMVDDIENGKIKNFDDALLNALNAPKVIAAGLFALGFSNVDSTEANGLITFNFNRLSEAKEQVFFDLANRKLLGDLALDIEKAFDLGVAIETRLSKAMLYPHDMRQKVISSVCADLNISDSLYALVLSNWKVS